MYNTLKKIKWNKLSIRIEACTLCQLNCKKCYMHLDKSVGVEGGYLSYENFVKFLNKNPFISKIELSNSGEIFLNPDLIKILKYAYEHHILLKAFNGVNFNTVSDRVLEALVKYQFNCIAFSIDGASQTVYSKYRRNGNFDKVISNIKRLNYYKQKHNSAYPILYWQYIVMEDTEEESEIKQAKRMAFDLNMRISFKKTWDAGFKPKNNRMLEEETGLIYSKKTLYSNEKRGRWVPCFDLWFMPQINWDGKFLGCCCNYKKDFGINVFDIGFLECLSSKIIKKTKKMLMGGKVIKDSPCANCWFYKEMVINKKFIKKYEFLIYLLNGFISYFVKDKNRNLQK